MQESCVADSVVPDADSPLDEDEFGNCIQSLPRGTPSSEHRTKLLLSRRKLLAPQMQYRFEDFYQLYEKLGEGSFGFVREAVAHGIDPTTGRPAAPASARQGSSPSNRRVAVKTFQVGQLGVADPSSPRTAALDMRKRQSFEAEREILAELEHPHIVKMFECFEDPSGLYLVLELCRGGELYGRMVKNAKEGKGGGLDEVLVRKLFRQMLSATCYLHSKRIVHRDLKTENFLLLGEVGTNEENVVKLCDFGSAARLSDARPRCMDKVGTLSYTPPEVYESRGADVSADSWSLGVVLYVLLTGTNPFRAPGSSREDTVSRIKAADFEQKRGNWTSLSDPAKDLIKQMLLLEEPKRLTAAEALQHPWVIGGDDRALLLCPTLRTRLSSYVPRMLGVMRRIRRLDTVQLLVLMTCAKVASEAELVHMPPALPWCRLFIALDSDLDGRLSCGEFVRGMQSLVGEGTSEEQLRGLALSLDADESGWIEWVEWLALAVLDAHSCSEAPDCLGNAFRLLDRPSGDGNIGVGDVLAVAQAQGGFGEEPFNNERDCVAKALTAWFRHRTNGKNSMQLREPVLSFGDVRFIVQSAHAHALL